MERPVALWIKRNRKARAWKVEELSRRLTQAGYDATPATIRAWEAPSGRDPSARNVEAMERIFDDPAPIERKPDNEIIAAIDRLTETVATLSQVPALRSEVADLRRELLALAVEVERLQVGDAAMRVGDDQDRAE